MSPDLPRRLRRAARICNVFGALLLPAGVIGLAYEWTRAAGPAALVEAAVVSAIGAGYLTCGHHLGRGRRGAAVPAIVLTSLALLAVAAVVTGEVYAAQLLFNIFGSGPWTDLLPMALVVLTPEGLVAAGLVWAIVQLWRALRPAADDVPAAGHGFAVLPVAVVPADGGQSEDGGAVP